MTKEDALERSRAARLAMLDEHLRLLHKAYDATQTMQLSLTSTAPNITQIKASEQTCIQYPGLRLIFQQRISGYYGIFVPVNIKRARTEFGRVILGEMERTITLIKEIDSFVPAWIDESEEENSDGE